MVPGVLGDAVEDVGHLAAAHHRLELGGRQLDRHLEVAGVAAVDDHRRRAALVHAREQPRHEVERALGRREPDALQAAAALGHERVEPLEAQREVAAPLVAGERVHLVDDHGAHAAQQRARRRRGEEEVERLGRGHEQVGRLLLHGGPLGRRRVAGAHGDAQPGVGVAEAGRLLPDLRQRDVEVLVHVDGEGPQRRDVEHLGRAPGPGARLGGPVGGVDGDQEPRQGLARAGRARPPARRGPSAMWGQAADCGGVGPAGKRRANQLATAGWKSDSGPGSDRVAGVGHGPYSTRML